MRYICVITATITDQNNEFLLWPHFLFGILVVLSSVIEGPVQITERPLNILLMYYEIINLLLFKHIQLSMLCDLLKLLCKCAGKHSPETSSRLSSVSPQKDSISPGNAER